MKLASDGKFECCMPHSRVQICSLFQVVARFNILDVDTTVILQVLF